MANTYVSFTTNTFAILKLPVKLQAKVPDYFFM